MIRHLMLAAIAVLPILLGGCVRNTGDEQSLVDRATLTIQEMMTQTVSDDPQAMLRRAKAAMICPRVFKAGFFFGGEGGSCVLLARAANGTWSYPAFYGIASGSFGFQFGVQDSQLVLMVLTDKGLNAVMDSQIKLGANASIAVANVGASVQGSTTAAVGADIVAFALSRGLFGGVALEGSVMSTRTEWNQTYYGQPFAARQIVAQMQGVNPGADPLRGVLTRYGGAASASTPLSNPGYAAPGYPPAYQPQSLTPSLQAAPPLQTPGYLPVVPPGGRGPVQQQLLTPPR